MDVTLEPMPTMACQVELRFHLARHKARHLASLDFCHVLSSGQKVIALAARHLATRSLLTEHIFAHSPFTHDLLVNCNSCWAMVFFGVGKQFSGVNRS